MFEQWKIQNEQLKQSGLNLGLSFECEFNAFSPAGEALQTVPPVAFNNTIKTKEEPAPGSGTSRFEAICNPSNVPPYPTPEECLLRYFAGMSEIKDFMQVDHLQLYGEHLHVSYAIDKSTLSSFNEGRFNEILESVLTLNWQAARPVLCSKEMLAANPATDGPYVNEIIDRKGIQEEGRHHFIVRRRGRNHWEVRDIFAPPIDSPPIQDFPNPMMFAQTLLLSSINVALEAYKQEVQGFPEKAEGFITAANALKMRNQEGTLEDIVDEFIVFLERGKHFSHRFSVLDTINSIGAKSGSSFTTRFVTGSNLNPVFPDGYVFRSASSRDVMLKQVKDNLIELTKQHSQGNFFTLLEEVENQYFILEDYSLKPSDNIRYFSSNLLAYNQNPQELIQHMSISDILRETLGADIVDMLTRQATQYLGINIPTPNTNLQNATIERGPPKKDSIISTAPFSMERQSWKTDISKGGNLKNDTQNQI